MAGLKEINIRIKSVKNTKKITYAMKLVSATKMRGAQDAVLSSREYSDAIESLMHSVLASTNSADLSHPFLEKREIKKVKLIVIGANRGLCGAFNSNVNKAVAGFYKDMKSKNVTVDAVICGTKQLDFFKREKLSYSEVYSDLGEKVHEWPLDDIARKAEIEFENGEIDAVYLIYTKFKSALSMTAETKQLLPISLDDIQPKKENEQENEEGTVQAAVAKFEPSTDAVFAALLPRLVQIALMQSALDSKASEHASRMTAMDNATKNAGDLIDSLTLKFNKLRQAGITSEILDIVGGANAISD